MSYIVVVGDCVEEMAKMPADSVNAVVTDPPYMLTSVSRNGSPRQNDEAKPYGRHKLQSAGGFMGAKWDAPDENTPRGMQAWHETWAREAFRVLKPGGHLLAFGGTRTYHRMVCAIEDAGFEIRDSVHWVYGSGFPKSLDVSKQIDKMAGAEREVVGRRTDRAATPITNVKGGNYGNGKPSDYDGSAITAPATEAAQQWQGWGTALKPAHEPICVARKPLSETSVARNVLRHGTGAINVDATRVEGTPHCGGARMASSGKTLNQYSDYQPGPNKPGNTSGRWPPNLLLSHHPDCKPTGEVRRAKGTSRPGGAFRNHNIYGEHVESGGNYPTTYTDPDGTEPQEVWECVASCPVRLLDEQSGQLKSGSLNAGHKQGGGNGYGYGKGHIQKDYGGDTGGASRFFPRFEGEAPSGRWPPNLLLSHHPDCKPTGEVRRVKPGNGSGIARKQNLDGRTYNTHQEWGMKAQPRADQSHLDPDGTEPQEVWECVEGCPIRLLDEMSGQSKKRLEIRTDYDDIRGGNLINSETKSLEGPPGVRNYEGEGGASRFFPRFEAPFRYQAKASRRERNAGLEGMPEQPCGMMEDDNYPIKTGSGNFRNTQRQNHHPTVKPIALMRWLVRLVCPPNGTVLDPFAGSGSTGCAAVQEGVNFIGIEMDAEYAEIARRRIAHWSLPEEQRPRQNGKPEKANGTAGHHFSKKLLVRCPEHDEPVLSGAACGVYACGCKQVWPDESSERLESKNGHTEAPMDTLF